MAFDGRFHRRAGRRCPGPRPLRTMHRTESLPFGLASAGIQGIVGFTSGMAVGSRQAAVTALLRCGKPAPQSLIASVSCVTRGRTRLPRARVNPRPQTSGNQLRVPKCTLRRFHRDANFSEEIQNKCVMCARVLSAPFCLPPVLSVPIQ